ncbi:hypothetical protein [Pseudomonas sp. 58 R 3]|nr:hypothetical protein [Pseudomonas sp. 58 R 3]
MAPVAPDRRCQHIQRHRNMHRPWALAVEHRIGAGDQFGQILGTQGHRRKRGDRRGDGALVLGFVQAAPAFAEAGGVIDAGDHQHRDRVGVGLANRCSGIGHAGPGDHKTHARFAADPRIAVGHKTGALLVARQHMANATAGQAAIQLQGVDTRNAEHRVDAIISQQPHQGLAAGQDLILHVHLLGESTHPPPACRGH